MKVLPASPRHQNQQSPPPSQSQQEVSVHAVRKAGHTQQRLLVRLTSRTRDEWHLRGRGFGLSSVSEPALDCKIEKKGRKRGAAEQRSRSTCDSSFPERPAAPSAGQERERTSAPLHFRGDHSTSLAAPCWTTRVFAGPLCRRACKRRAAAGQYLVAGACQRNLSLRLFPI